MTSLVRRLFAGGHAQFAREMPLFDPAFYLSTNPDVAKAGADPLFHYMTHGWREGRNPSSDFHTLYYRDKNLNGNRRDNPFQHYHQNKDKMELSAVPKDEEEILAIQYQAIHSHFDDDFYREKYLKGEPSADPIDHYLRTGWRQGYDPTPNFSTSGHTKAHPFVVYLKRKPFLPLHLYQRFRCRS